MTIDIRNKRIALIGGAGFIGHHLALELRNRQADVHALDSLQVNNLGEFSNAQGDPNKALYLYLINERMRLLNENGIPLHVIDAREILVKHAVHQQFDIERIVAQHVAFARAVQVSDQSIRAAHVARFGDADEALIRLHL